MNMRKNMRSETLFHSKLTDAVTGELIGYQLNVSQRGVCFMIDHPMEVGRNLNLRLDLPQPVCDRTFTEFHAIVRWCQQDADPTYYIVGCELNEPSIETMHIFIELMESACFPR